MNDEKFVAIALCEQDRLAIATMLAHSRHISAIAGAAALVGAIIGAILGTAVLGAITLGVL